jgi:hypothetical protein
MKISFIHLTYIIPHIPLVSSISCKFLYASLMFIIHKKTLELIL